MNKYFFVCTIFQIILNCGNAFNLSPVPSLTFIEPKPNFLKNKNESSYFGYTIVFQRQSIIISAPRAMSKSFTENGIINSGAIYKCYTDTNKCFEFIPGQFSNDQHSLHKNGSGMLLKKENQWLGAAMDGLSSATDHLVACAPNIITEMNSNFTPTEHNLNGVCYFIANKKINSTDSLDIIAPLREQSKQLNEKGSFLWALGQLGFSVHMINTAQEILIGAPGVRVWQGAIIRYNIVNAKSEVSEPKDLPHHSYFGYAVTSGLFLLRYPNQIFYVASAPRYNMYGKVIIFEFIDENMVNKRTFIGKQAGEYFGYALITDDFNSDSLIDLVISAPLFKSNSSFDTGRVYYFRNNKQLQFMEPIHLYPNVETNGRFGTTLGKIGDINRDGYNDIAVGAPFEGNGVVYIFLGGHDGLSPKHSQKLLAPVNQHTVPHYFGHGLSKGLDYDQNGYNDIVVGAPNIDVAYIYKSYPVVKINASISPISTLINIEETESKIKYCIKYNTVGSIKFKVNVDLAIKLDPLLNRAKFLNGENVKNSTLSVIQEDHCEEIDIKLQNTINNIFKPITLEFHYQLTKKYNNLNSFCTDCVAVNPSDLQFVTNKIIFSTRCKNIRCIADLKIQSKVLVKSIPYVLGSSKTISIEYTISNYGEKAYFVQLIVNLNSKLANFNRIPSDCYVLNKIIMTCKVMPDSPFENIKNMPSIIIPISVDTTDLEGSKLNITAYVTNAGDEANSNDNTVIDLIPLTEISDIEISGKSSDEDFSVEDTPIKLKEIENFYEIRNYGPSNIKTLDFIISIPIVYLGKNSKEISLIKLDETNLIGKYDNEEMPLQWLEEHNYKEELKSNEHKIEYIIDQNLKSLPHNRTIYFNCSSTEARIKFCKHAKVQIKNFKSGHKLATFYIKFIVDLEKIKKLYSENHDRILIQITSMVQKPNDDEFESNGKLSVTILDASTLITKFIQKKTPWWIIILSIIIGILIFALLAYVLYRVGFFKRKRKDEMAKLIRKSQIEEEINNSK